MDVRNYRTKTIMKEVCNPYFPDKWTIGIDVGYSAVKVYAPNKVFSFPTFALESEIRDISLITRNSGAIRYRNAHDIVYEVGGRAISIANDNEVYENEAIMYGRQWYSNTTYQVCLEAALALAIMSNNVRAYKGEPIYVASGLPSKFISDQEVLKALIEGHHSFDIVPPGETEWKHFDFDIVSASIMEQPLGALWSALYDDSAHLTSDANDLINSNILIFDAGFGTLDLFGIVDCGNKFTSTHANCGMKEVYKLTVNDIKKQCGKEIPIPLLYKYLNDGKITFLKLKNNGKGIKNINDHNNLVSTVQEFSDILERNSRFIAERAVSIASSETDQLSNYKYVLLAGGSTAAWNQFLQTTFKEFGKHVIHAGRNNRNLDAIFSIVRGYYMNLLALIKLETEADK